MELTQDHLLNRRVILSQPKTGYRAGSDAILLAAAVPALAGQTVLDAGAGVGAVALCLAIRVENVTVRGLERQAELTELAADNAAANGLADRVNVLCGDIHQPPEEITRAVFDHTVCNPPFHPVGRASPSPDRSKALAHSEGETPLSKWLSFCLRRTRPGGTVTMIHRASRLHDILAGWKDGAGDVVIIPLWPKAGRPARRIIVQARVGGKGPMVLHPGLQLHQYNGTDTDKAQAILRGGMAMDLAISR